MIFPFGMCKNCGCPLNETGPCPKCKEEVEE